MVSEERLNYTREVFRKNIEQHNKMIEFARYAFPLLADEWNKLTGKRFGEKTKEKFVKAMKEHGIDCYLNNGAFRVSDCRSSAYGCEWIDIGKNYDGYTCMELLDANNVCLKIEAEGLIVWYQHNHYFDDVDTAVEEATKMYYEAVEAQEELKDKCDKFNEKYSVGSIRSISQHKYIYDRPDIQ